MIGLGLGLPLGLRAGEWTPAQLLAGGAGFWAGGAGPV